MVEYEITAVIMGTCRALLFGGLKESRPECSEVELKDTNAFAFEVLLRYIYTGRIRLLDLKVSQYVCSHVFMHACMHACTHARMHTHAHTIM